MSDTAIRIEGLGKRYQVGPRLPYGRLTETLANMARWRPSAETLAPAKEFWALQDVSFSVRRGEVLGIIGRNGAGKSTLLKILARITEPTHGDVWLHGRVGSLLEVGTGFHPELSGRENVFLNGAILGMRKNEIAKVFDEIVSFSEIEQFLDTPVKHYSSGMYMRLAFSVAAHLQSDILLIDEVLAVGDMHFQAKCIGKISDVARTGRTVVFISHNLGAVKRLCPLALYLERGHLLQYGKTEDVIGNYIHDATNTDNSATLAQHVENLPLDPNIRLRSIRVIQEQRVATAVFNGEPVEVEIDYEVLAAASGLRLCIDLCDEQHELLIRSFDDELDQLPGHKPAGKYRSRMTIPANTLAPRIYSLEVNATIHNVRYCTGGGIPVALVVQTTSLVNANYPHEPIRGKMLSPMRWTTMRIE
jgi:lipopolysaccharide transport system ATP-binding protein